MNDRFKFKCVINNKVKDVFYFYELPTNKEIVFACTNLEDNTGYNIPKSQLLQCTGLKDKNGKLIYEGDILQSDEYPFKNEKGYNYAAEVLWDDASATFYYYTFRISNNVVGRSTGNTGELNEHEDWEVIGNIYENPELLKECE